MLQPAGVPPSPPAPAEKMRWGGVRVGCRQSLGWGELRAHAAAAVPQEQCVRLARREWAFDRVVHAASACRELGAGVCREQVTHSRGSACRAPETGVCREHTTGAVRMAGACRERVPRGACGCTRGQVQKEPCCSWCTTGALQPVRAVSGHSAGSRFVVQ